MNRWLWQYCAGALLLCIGLALSQPGSAAAQAEPLPAGLVSFGHELAGGLNRGEDMTALLIPQDVTCPQYFPDGRIPMTPIAICVGVADGTVVQACLFGRLGSDAGPGDCSRLGTLLAQIRQSEFQGRALQLFTASPDGRAVGGLACPECATLIYSSTVDATSTATKAPHVLELQVTAVNGGWRIYALAVGDTSGDGGSATVYGGTFDGRTFIVVPPAAPDVGTGLQPAGSDHVHWMLPALLGSALAVIGVAGFARQQQRRPAR